MTDATAVRRKILTYALVSQNFSGKRDPVTALYPLFAPIAVDFSGQAFAAAAFQAEMRSRYGMDLTRDVVDLFGQRLSQLGLIQGSGAKAIWSASGVAAHNLVQDEQSTLDQLTARAQEFHAASRDLVSSPFNEEEFLSALMRVVLDSNQAVKNAVVVATGEESGAEGRAKDADEYFAAKFITWTKDVDPELFAWIAELGGAAIVAEALVELRSPSLPTSVSPDLTLYLDTPFLMELLGCSGKAAREDAKYIHEQLKLHRINVAVFSHLIDELRYNLKAVLKTNPLNRTGPSAVALLYQEVTEQYLTDVLDDPEYFIKEIGLRIVNFDRNSADSDSIYFTAEDQHSYYASIQSYYNHPEAAQRDADSVAWIMRRRRGEQSRDILKAKHALLTRNALVYRQINRFCLNRGYVKQDRAGPVVLARDLAGVLWLLSGTSERTAISHKQLLLNCQRARANAPKVVAGMVETLREVNPESAELFMAAVNKPSYLSLALDTVASSGTGITREIAETTLEKIRDDLVSEERLKARRKIEQQNEKHERDSNLKELVIESLKDERASLTDLRQKDEESWRSLSNRQWLAISRSSRMSWVFGQVAANVIVFGVTAFGVYAGSDLLAVPDWAKVAIGIAIALAGSVLGNLASRDLLRRLIEKDGQSRYGKWLTGNVPMHHHEAATVNQPMIVGSFFEIAPRVLSKD